MPDSPNYAKPLMDEPEYPAVGSSGRAARACECSDCERLILFEEEVWYVPKEPDLVFCSPRCRTHYEEYEERLQTWRRRLGVS
jgi:hypothetical protein